MNIIWCVHFGGTLLSHKESTVLSTPLRIEGLTSPSAGAVLEDSIILMNTIYCCPVAATCQASHTLSQAMLSASGHYTSCPDDETEGQSGPGHPAMT